MPALVRRGPPAFPPQAIPAWLEIGPSLRSGPDFLPTTPVVGSEKTELRLKKVFFLYLRFFHLKLIGV